MLDEHEESEPANVKAVATSKTIFFMIFRMLLLSVNFFYRVNLMFEVRA